LEFDLPFDSSAVMSAMSGLQGEVKGFGTNALVMSSIVILVALFSIQRFGTGKVGFLFAPVLALWFFSLGAIGIYNLLKYDFTVIRALNPFYIVLFFNKNSKQAWSALGGCVLCITGKSTRLTTSKINQTFLTKCLKLRRS
jgi:KUP system potassium uptake protein